MTENMSAILKFVHIKNFRSIIDSEKFYVPADGITILVGQNESGKTSIIDALEAFDSEIIDNEDRTNRNEPTTIICTFSFTNAYLQSIFSQYKRELDFLSRFIKNDELEVEVEVLFLPKKTEGEVRFVSQYRDEYSQLLQEKFGIDNSENVEKQSTPDSASSSEKSTTTVEIEEEDMLALEEVEKLLMQHTPRISIFKDNSLLPREILLSEIDNKISKADGIEGARNFLKVLDVSLETLKEDIATPTEKQTLQTKLNEDFSADFNTFWTQEVIPGNKAKIHIALANVSAGEPNAGADIFRFTVETRGKHLFPDQRSKGFQWFLSFYLQLMVLGKTSERPNILLIDEPGAHLHVKAKKDLQTVLEQVKNRAQIIYTTHEPELIDTGKLNRIRVITQVATEDGSLCEGTKAYTVEKSATRFGATDALSPVYKAIGSDFSSVRIDKESNAILEEPSAYYYLTAWEKILGIGEHIFLLPAMGVNNVPLYFSLLTSWGFKNKVVLDDDDKGRAVYKQIVEEWALPEEERKTRLFKLKNGPTIEELFTPIDFQKFVLSIPTADLKKKIKVAELINKGDGKALFAKRFLEKVNRGELTKEKFEVETVKNFKEVVEFLDAN